MSAFRWMPILGLLAVMALVPTALAHHCIPDEDQNSSDGFSVQSTAAPVATPFAIGALVFVPLVVIGGVVAAVRSAPGVAPARTAGRWVCTPTHWVWVPEDK